MADRGPVPVKSLLVMLALVGSLLLPNLGSRLYWGDEREDFNFIWRILEYGVPYMKGGHTGDTPQVNDDYLHVYHPWMYLYTNTLSVKLFGWDNRFMFRLSGVLWTLLSVAAVWRLARRLGQEGYLTIGLYCLSPFVLVPARLSRYYGAVMGLSPLVIYFYLSVKDKKPGASWKLALALSLLFHHNTLAATALGLGCFFHWSYSKFPNFKGYFWAFLLASVPILGWVFWAGMVSQGSWIDFSLFPAQAVKSIWLLLASTLPFPVLVWAFFRTKKFKGFLILFICFLTPLFFLTSSSIWVTPNLRYFLPVVGLSFCLVGLFLESLAKTWRVVLFAVLALTNFLNLIPLSLINFLPTEKLALYGRSSDDALRFFRVTATPRFLFLGHLAEIYGHYEGPGDVLLKMLNKSGYQPGETIHMVYPEGVDRGLYARPLTAATFEVYQGKPGEMLGDVFTTVSDAQWVITVDDTLKDDQWALTAQENNAVGFWIEGPNPFNRRWQTARAQTFYLYKRLATTSTASKLNLQ